MGKSWSANSPGFLRYAEMSPGQIYSGPTILVSHSAIRIAGTNGERTDSLFTAKPMHGRRLLMASNWYISIKPRTHATATLTLNGPR